MRRFALTHRTKDVEYFAGPSRRDRLVLDPPYQRAAAWNQTQQQNLILSLRLGLPIGAITTNERPYEVDPEMRDVVVDGQQRIRALRAFVDGEILVPAEWFTDDAGVLDGTTCGPIDYQGQEVEGVGFSGLSQAARRKFFHMPVPVVAGSLPTERDEALLYGLINFGGTPQTDTDRARAEAIASGGTD